MDYDLERPDMLMARIQHAQAVNGYRQMKKHNIHPKQLPILLTLMAKEGISQRELAKQLHVKPPTIAVSVKRLSASGLIVKVEDEKDARISHLYLTDAAKQVMEETKNTICSAADRMLDGFTENEIMQFTGYLKRILNNLGPFDEESRQMACDAETYLNDADASADCGEEFE